MIVGLDHVQLAMPPGGEGRARAFYANVLGMKEVAKPAGMVARGGCWFVGGSAHVHLGIEKDFRPARKAHPALLVDDLAQLRNVLAVHEVAFNAGDTLDGCVRGNIADPFGNRIELVQKL
ncbi:VOC family protein [Tsuneonella sp. SYSU-LHT278]|uniref:VOC family protein n=1 Tax=Tsuneonella sediminis TaxID=3416089 RepID=UPI003F7924E0